MRFLVTHISAFALVAHFMLGCCAHHVDCGSEAVAYDDASAGCSHDEPANHDHESTVPEPGHQHAPPNNCRHVPCAAVRVLKAHAPEFSPDSHLVAVLSRPAFVPWAQELSYQPRTVGACPGEPPRLNLLYQVFLI